MPDSDTAPQPRLGPRQELWGVARRGFPILALVAAAPAIGALAGDLWWGFELLAHFHGCWAFMLAVVALVLVLVRYWRGALAIAALAVVDLAFVVPLWIGPVANGPHDLRVMTVNVHSMNLSHAPLLELVAREKPDVLAVLELTRAWVDALEKLRADYPHQIIEPRPDNFGIGLFSRRPCRFDIEYIGNAGLASAIASLEVRDTPLLIVATHPLPPEFRGPPIERDEQITKIAHRVADRAGAAIVLGDLNTSSWTRSFAELCEVGRVRDSRAGFGIRPTWPGRYAAIGIAIDHVLVSEEFAVCGHRVGPWIESDHRPVTVDLRLPR